MDFFERQQKARRTTVRLGVLFGLALVGIVLALYVGGLVILRLLGVAPASPWWWRPVWLAGSALSILVLCGTSTWYMLRRLRTQGGAALATLIGARPVHYARATPNERMLLNVVQEMAIAASLPVPWVYLLDHEPGINAFAAGYTPDDAVITVTSGALHALSRDELQGIVAHEFSHILYADTRVNTWLLGMLSGLRLLSSMGVWLLNVPARLTENRDATLGCTLILGIAFVLIITGMILYLSGAYAASRLSLSWLILLPLGAIVLVVGGLGFVFGRLIQRAVARQREYLADAAAIQFTRHPVGLARALTTIEKHPSGGRIIAPAASQASHFFFADPHASLFEGPLLATHPPLSRRRARLTQFQPSLATVLAERAQPAGTQQAAATTAVDARAVLASVGSPTAEHVAYGHDVIERMPPALYEATNDPTSAVAVVYGLLLDAGVTLRSRQATTLQDTTSRTVQDHLVRLQPLIDDLPPEARLPLVELLVPALRRLTPKDQQRFTQNVRHLAEADQTLSLFEFVLSELLSHWLRRARQHAPDGEPAVRDLSVLRPDCALLLSALAHAGHDDASDAHRAFEVGWLHLPDRMPRSELLPPSRGDYTDLREALARVQHVSLPARRTVLTACVHCVLADGYVAPSEAELLRVIAVLFDSPIPPFLASVR